MNLSEFCAFHDKNPRIGGRFLMVRLAGSTSYNTSTANSDNDFLAVHVAPTEKILSLDTPPQTVTNTEGEKPDWTSHEVGKFCNLLLSGNPTVIECALAKRDFVATGFWQEIIDNRKIFLTKKSVKNYLGYAQGQLQRMMHGRSVHGKGGIPDEKFSYHIIRLLMDAKAIASGAEPVIFKEGTDRDFLMRIRAGEFTPEQIGEMSKVRIAEIDAMKPWPIPDEIDKSFLSNWLLRLRRSNF